MINCAAAQYPITQHAHFEAWRAHTEGWVVDAIRQNANVLLFPEYGSMELVSLFSAGIRSDIRRQVKEMNILRGGFCTVFSDLARKYGVIIVAPSFPIWEVESIFNRTYVFSSKGLVGYQDKFFMTRFENEEWGIQSANPKKLMLFEADWGSFGIQICYDVEFGIGSQWLCAAGASIIFAPSCTETIRGATRVHVGARAEIIFAPEPPRDATAMRPALAQAELNHALHLYLINRGILIAPFHMMMLVCPLTTRDQIDRLVAAVDSFAEDYTKEVPA
jgi:predicted amidohydrolase